MATQSQARTTKGAAAVTKFHVVHNPNVTLSEEDQHAISVEAWNGLTFSADPLDLDERLRLRIAEVHRPSIRMSVYGFMLGVTSTDPNKLNPDKLDVLQLADFKTLTVPKRYLFPGKIIHVTIKKRWDKLLHKTCRFLQFAVNGVKKEHEVKLKDVDVMLPLWLVLNIPNSLGVKIMGVSSLQAQIRLPTVESDECGVCSGDKTDCVFVMCGHQIICLACAKKLWKKWDECPLCKNPIEEVLQIFKS